MELYVKKQSLKEEVHPHHHIKLMEEAVRQMMSSSVGDALDPKDKSKIRSLAAQAEKGVCYYV